jgi:hypothetical protein
MSFIRNMVLVGSIDVTTTATSYVTSSDYRLKYDIAPMYEFSVATEEFEGVPDIIQRILKWEPVTFKFKHDEDKETKWGFIAHRLQEFAPYAVTGTKDAVDEFGTAYSVTAAEVIEDITEAEATDAGLLAWEWNGVKPVTYPQEVYDNISETDAHAKGCETWIPSGMAMKTIAMDGSAAYVDYGTGTKAAYSEPERGIATRPEIRREHIGLSEEDAKGSGLVDWTKTEERPAYQGVDHSKLVPELTAALQATLDLLLETRLQVKALTARIEELEG